MGHLLTRLNDKVHPLMVRYLDSQFVKKNRLVRKIHPEYFVPNKTLETEAHKQLWQPVKLSGHVDASWYVMHCNIAGNNDIRYVPEHIYFPYIEPVMNDLEMASYISDKNMLGSFVPEKNTPKTVLRYIGGLFFDSKFNLLNQDKAQTLLDEQDNVILKPSVDSSGGSGVQLRNQRADSRLTVDELLTFRKMPYIIQAKIIQHRQSSVFNESSVNTCRIMTLRCPWNGRTVLLKSMLRIGGGKSVCDNMMLGGLCVGVNDDGTLAKYAYDYNGERYERHPDSGKVFASHKLPLYPEMVKLALDVASRVPYMNIISFDIVADEDENPICLELNTAGQGITQLQYDGLPLFREYTDDVVKWCASHKDYNKLRHIKTFYW